MVRGNPKSFAESKIFYGLCPDWKVSDHFPWLAQYQRNSWYRWKAHGIFAKQGAKLFISNRGLIERLDDEESDSLASEFYQFMFHEVKIAPKPNPKNDPKFTRLEILSNFRRQFKMFRQHIP